MTTYELAHLLLAGPNEPVYVASKHSLAPEPVGELEVLSMNEWEHPQTGESVLKDINGQALPENYTVVMSDTDPPCTDSGTEDD